MMISRPLYSDEFVGRRVELRFLADEFAAACKSGLRLVLIEGEAGIGKTRLLAEFFSALAAEATVVAGRCSEQVRSPYQPFAEIVNVLDPRSRLAALRPREPAVRQSEEKWAYFNAVAEVIRAEASRHPVAIAVEDAQWADDASIELLRFLPRRIVGSRCMLLVTLRSENFGQNAAAAALRSAGSRARGTTLQLRPLRRHEIKHLVQESVQKRGASLPPATVAQIEALAEGNPLFAEELARVALETGALSLHTHLPVTAESLLSERLSGFTPGERGLLYRAAVIGQSFDVWMLSAIASRDAADVLSVLERAVDGGLVQELAPNRFSFRHELVRQVLADRLVLSLAAPLHRRIAEELESLPNARERAAELAYHWSAARVAEKARVWNEHAARAALDVYAYRDAIRFYTDALRWEYPPGISRAGVYERLGTLLYVEGCGEEPARWFSLAAEEYQRYGNAVGAAHALLLEADQRWVDARTRESAKMAADAGDMLRSLGHRQLYAESLLGVARYAITLGEVERARAHLMEAAPFRQGFDAGSQASWHEVLGETYAVSGDARSAVSEFRAAAQLAAQSGVGELISQIENNFALAAFDLGDLDLAAARHQIAVDEAHRTGLMWRIAYSSLNYARTLTFKGQLERARSLVGDAFEAGVTTATFKTKAASVGIPLAVLLNDRALLNACAHESALAFAEQSGEIQRIASVGAAFAALRAVQGSEEEARRIVGRALRQIPHAHRAWDIFIAVARWGSPEDLRYARHLLEGSRGRPFVKRAYRLFFESLALRKRTLAAARLGESAARGFDRMGNTLYAAMARGSAGMAALEMPRDDGRRLTERQRQVAELVAEGETNRAIAQRLHISEHTVEHHISAIFVRLGLHSRAQVANMLGREHGNSGTPG
jgi:DNA-binding CsgD family transcriptional regulator